MNLKNFSAVTGRILACALGLLALTSAKAQEKTSPPPVLDSLPTSETANLPEAPKEALEKPGQDPSLQTSAQKELADREDMQQTKRILWIVPNFRAVSADTRLPPQSVKEKFKTGFLDSFDYSSFIFAGLQAGISQATDSYPDFHEGGAGYGRYYWHTFADQADENLWVEAILPSVLHQDSRYYTLGHGGFLKRGTYAVSRMLITRDDAGGETFNASEIAGAGIAAGISSAYYPTRYQTWTKIGQRWLTNCLLDSATFGAKEFWPDINGAIFHSKN